MFDSWRGFTASTLPQDWHQKLTEQARHVRGDILKMTTLAGSGHPGGSMSSTEIFLTLYSIAKVDPKDPYCDDRDRIIVSHGHTSPGVYSSLAAVGFFNVKDAIAGFRLGGSPFEGHVEQSVPGVEWDTGNLGQGLAAGVGKAIYARLSGKDFHTYVVMGDGEQQKGQISESRRIAVKYRLNNLTAIIDYNKLQISGSIENVMPQNIADDWKADGWQVVEIDGHDLNQVYEALHRASRQDGAPIMILARTVMGKGVSFMENDHTFHGVALKRDKLGAALEELGGIENDIEQLDERRAKANHPKLPPRPNNFPDVQPAKPIVYGADVSTDNRSAFGKALL